MKGITGDDLLTLDQPGWTLLHWAVSYGDEAVDKVRGILATKEGMASLRTKDGSGRTPLHLAASYGYVEIVKAILETKGGMASLSIKSKNGRTPLSLAALHDHVEIVKAILETKEGKESLKRRDILGHTPLHLAILGGNVEVVKEILKIKEGEESLRIKNKWRKTSLELAASYGTVEIVKAILATKGGMASLSGIDVSDKTPLGLAVENGKAEIAEIIKGALATGKDMASLGTAKGQQNQLPSPQAALRGKVATAKATSATEENKAEYQNNQCMLRATIGFVTGGLAGLGFIYTLHASSNIAIAITPSLGLIAGVALVGGALGYTSALGSSEKPALPERAP